MLVYCPTLITVVNGAGSWPTSPDRHLERVQDQLGAEMAGHRPADHGPAEGVHHDRQVEEAGPGRDVADVGHPESVRALGLEVALDEIRSGGCFRRPTSGPLPPPPMATLQSELPHQPRHSLLGTAQAIGEAKFGADSGRPIGTAREAVNVPDQAAQALVLLSPAAARS
jgi:hypothetical protein